MHVRAAHRRRSRGLLVVAAGGCVLLTAACGTRLSHQELLADAQGALVTVAPEGAATGDTSAPNAVTPAAGTATSAPAGGPIPSSAAAVAAPVSGGVGTAVAPVGGSSTAAATSSAPGKAIRTGKPTPTGKASASAIANAAGGCAASDGSPITIGSVSELSGPAGASQAQGITAVQVWANMVNDAGGICGHKVQFIAEDDQSDPNKANSEIQDLAQNRHVVAFVGEMIGQIGEQIAPTLAKTGAPTFGGECANLAWQKTVGLFSECSGPTSEAYQDLYVAAHYGSPTKKLALITCIEASLCPAFRKAAEGFASQLGLQLVYDQTASLTQVDFTQQCIDMKNAGATMVTAVMDSASVGRIGVSCSRQGFNPLYAQGSATVSGTTISQPGLANLIAGVPTFPFAGITGNAAFDEFSQAMAKYDSGDPLGPAASFGWASAKLFERVARIAAASGPITRESLYAAAYTLKNDSLGGLTPPLTFVKGQPSADFKCGFYVDGRNGHYSAPTGLKLISAP